MSDPYNSGILCGVPCSCGGDDDGGSGGGGGGDSQDGARPIVVPQLLSTSRRSLWPISSMNSSSSLTDPISSNNPLSLCMGYTCTRESAAEQSHGCDPDSHQDRRLHFLNHPPQQQWQQWQQHYHHHHHHQFDLSTGLASPQAVTPLFFAAQDTLEPPTNDEDHHHCGVSAQPQGIASSPAAAIADQDFLPLASTLPSSWNNTPSPTPSFGSLSSTHSSNLSPETDFGGGAPIASEVIYGTLRNKHLSPHTGFNNNHSSSNNNSSSSEISQIDESEGEDSDGGIDLSGSEMASSGPVEVLYSSSALHATVMDEDEDDFSPNNLITRPPSPVGDGSSFFMDIFSSPSYEIQNPLENSSGDLTSFPALPSFHMQPNPPLDDVSSQPSVLETSPPSVVLLDSHLQSPSTASTPSEILVDSSSPDAQFPLLRGTDGLEITTGGDEELFVVESELDHELGPQESMHSQSSSQSPPTAAAVLVSPATLAAVAAEMMAAAVAGGFVPLPTHDSPPSPALPPPPPPPPPQNLSPLPPHFPTWTPNVFFTPEIYEGGSLSDEDDFDDITNHPFAHNLPLEDIENYNKDFAKFCLHAYCRHRLNSKFPKLLADAADVKNMVRPKEVTRAEMEENGWDYQAIPWDTLGISSEVARKIRRKEYTNYENIKGLEYDENLVRVPANRNFFEFRRMDNEQRCRLIHFQLRNLLGVISRNDVFYAGDALVVRTNPLTGKSRTMMDLRTPDSWSGNPIRISTLGTCGGSNGVVIAGCFYGEYAMKPLHAPADAAPITGIVTQNESGITNHVQMIKNRTTGTPNAVFSSNDHFIRVLNCGEGMRFISEHKYKWPVNCSVTSPDSRLRVVVGDDTQVLVCDAERGTTEFVLKGHRDYGFAAAWSDDGYTIATGNQDKTVRIFDARNLSKTVKVFPAVMAGARTLRFSPIGYGGKRVLAMAEPADIVQIVDAVSWDSLQQIDFWGEVGGIDFDPSGEEFYIANADKSVGGIMEFSRTKGSAYYEDYSYEKAQQRHNAGKGVRRRRRKRCAFVSSSDDDSESTAFSDEESVEDDDDVREQLDTRKRGRYYDTRRYKRLGHDMSRVFV